MCTCCDTAEGANGATWKGWLAEHTVPEYGTQTYWDSNCAADSDNQPVRTDIASLDAENICETLKACFNEGCKFWSNTQQSTACAGSEGDDMVVKLATTR